MARISSASTRDRASASASTRHRALPYHCISQSFDLPPATTSVSHLTCPLPPHHQSELVLVLELELALALEIELALVLDIEHYHITTSVSHLTCPCHHISQSFDLPLPPHHQSQLELALALVLDIEHYHITTSVSHLTCPLSPHQSVI